ncbi:MAG TPA: aldo/keto reductase [bacterium]|nr:aldo/keto reductase [bacterium]
MELRTFGQSTLRSSAIGLGTWPIGGARYGPSDDRDAIRTIAAALDAGVTCFDTAPSYGNGHAEELLGRALGPRRADAVVVTKGGLIWNAQSQVLGRDSRRDALSEHIAASLKRLQTDYIDLYLVHWPDPTVPLDDVAATLEGFVRTGKARHVGVSNFTGAQLRACASALRGARLTANQVSVNLFDQRWLRETFSTCRELGIGVMAYGPLAHGLLTGALTRATVFDDADWRKSGTLFGQALLTPGNFERNLDVVDRLAAVARRCGATLPQLAVAWVLSRPPVTVALIGARTPAEIADAAGATGVRLSEQVLHEIETIMHDAAGLSAVLPT